MTETCVHVGCDRAQRARRLCSMHYVQLKRNGLPPLVERKRPAKPVGLRQLAQEGRNRACVDCYREPYGGGLRCLPCFQVRCRERSDREARLGVGG